MNNLRIISVNITDLFPPSDVLYIEVPEPKGHEDFESCIECRCLYTYLYWSMLVQYLLACLLWELCMVPIFFSLGMLVPLVTSCMVLAGYLILKANTAPNSRHICFMLWASSLSMSLIGFLNFIMYTELRSNVVFRNSPYNWQTCISNWLKSTSVVWSPRKLH